MITYCNHVTYYVTYYLMYTYVYNIVYTMYLTMVQHYILQLLYVNITMQYGEAVAQGKSDSSLEVLTFLWINASGYIYYIVNALYEFAAKAT